MARRPSKPIRGSPDILIEFDRLELLRAPTLRTTLGESHFKLKLHLQGRKYRTFKDALAKPREAFRDPCSIAASSNLHKILRLTVQTEQLSRIVAFARMPLRSLELLAREDRDYVFALQGRDRLPCALVHCHVSLRLNMTAEEEREERLQDEELAQLLEPDSASSPVAALCARLRGCFGRSELDSPMPAPPPLRLSSSFREPFGPSSGFHGLDGSGNGRRKKTVTIHPDWL
jgi:hypothetical protein